MSLLRLSVYPLHYLMMTIQLILVIVHLKQSIRERMLQPYINPEKIEYIGKTKCPPLICAKVTNRRQVFRHFASYHFENNISVYMYE